MRGNRTDNAIKNAVASLALRAVSILSQFVLRTVFLRVLGNEYAGMTGLFTDILTVLSLAQLGLETSLVYSLYGPLARNDEAHAATLLAFYRRAFRAAAVVELAAGCLCAPFLSIITGGLPAVKEDFRLVFLLYVVYTSASCLMADRAALLKAEQRGRVVSVCSIAVQAAECAVSVWYLLAFRRFVGWLVVHIGFNLLKSLLLCFAADRTHPQLRRADLLLPKEERNLLLRRFLCLTAYYVSGAAVYSTDSIFISRFLGPAQVAVAGNYSLIVGSVRACAEQAAAAVRPSVGHLAVDGVPEKQIRVFQRMNLAAFIAACWGSACLLTLLNPFIGEIWLDASYCFPAGTAALITADFYIALMVFPVEAFRNANGLFLRGWCRPLATAGLNLLLDAVLGRYWGFNGIFLATALSRLLTQVWFDPLLLYRRVFGKGLRRYYGDCALKALLTVAVCFVTNGCAALFHPANDWLFFACRVAVCLVLPPFILWIVCRKSAEWAALKRAGLDFMKRTLKK